MLSKAQMLEKLQKFSTSIGSTPIAMYHDHAGLPIFAKQEYYNPTGSVKVRAAFSMILNLIEKASPKKLRNIEILEYSGGNLARALAHICNLLGIKIHLVLAEKSPLPLLNEIEALGAQIHLTGGPGFWAVVAEARRLAVRNPHWFFLDQLCNPANLNIHLKTTGPELVAQLGEWIPKAFVISTGTGATMHGVFKSLQQKFPGIELHIVTPKEQPYGDTNPPNSQPKNLGSSGLGDGRKQVFISEIETDVYQKWQVSFSEALGQGKQFKQDHGIAIGTSAAAAYKVAREIAFIEGENKSTNKKNCIVTLYAALATDYELAQMK